MVRTPKLKARAKVLTRLLELAEELMKIKNFNGKEGPSVALLCGLSSWVVCSGDGGVVRSLVLWRTSTQEDMGGG